ncbi:MAG: putative phosphoserine phosphatase 2 [Anaerolineales bacterium]|nr:putative phosphoserine phosphatase 2 [Anaerolineales bacterium]
MNRLYLIRHGENKANITKEFSYKEVDYPLTDKGRLQAQQTAKHFAGRDIDAIYSSPLKRAKETADIIADRLNLAVAVVENLREVNVGDLEGRPPTAENWALHNQVLKAWYNGDLEARFPDGEDYLTLRDRLRAGFRRIIDHKTDQDVIVVGHGGLFTATGYELCANADPEELRDQPLHNCSITTILVGRRDGHLSGELVTWGSHHHLHGDAAELVSGSLEADASAEGDG